MRLRKEKNNAFGRKSLIEKKELEILVAKITQRDNLFLCNFKRGAIVGINAGKINFDYEPSPHPYRQVDYKCSERFCIGNVKLRLFF